MFLGISERYQLIIGMSIMRNSIILDYYALNRDQVEIVQSDLSFFGYDTKLEIEFMHVSMHFIKMFVVNR